MKGYLMQDRQWVPGTDLFLDSSSPENANQVVLEYDGETLYFYALDKENKENPILDALHIWQKDEEPDERPVKLQIIWSRDWQKCALVMDGQCHAIFDFPAHGGYNVSEFPPPNDNWTRGDRKLTDEIIEQLF
jgi:hypothetical protein